MDAQSIRITLKAFDHRILGYGECGDREHSKAHRRKRSWSGAFAKQD